MLKIVSGPRQSIQYTPGAPVSAGDVIVVGGLACISNLDNPTNAQDPIRQGGLHIFGGIYQGYVDATVPQVGQYVFWDSSALRVTLAKNGNAPLGYVVAGPGNGVMSDSSPANPNDACYILHDPQGSGGGTFYVEVGPSTAVSNTTAETLFDKNVTLPAGFLEVGDIIRVRGQGIVTAVNSTNTFAFKLYIGGLTGTAIATITAANPSVGDVFYFDTEVIVRTIGVSGAIVAEGVAAQGTPGVATPKLASLASTTVNTTLAQQVGVSVAQSVANAGNSCRLDALNVSIARR